LTENDYGVWSYLLAFFIVYNTSFFIEILRFFVRESDFVIINVTVLYYRDKRLQGRASNYLDIGWLFITEYHIVSPVFVLSFLCLPLGFVAQTKTDIFVTSCGIKCEEFCIQMRRVFKHDVTVKF
jgi:hypothetical protein